AGETLPPTPADRYGRYLQLVRELDDDHARFESVAAWWERTKPVFLDPVLAEQCTYGRELPADAEARAANAAVLVSVARHLGNELVDPISRALGRSLAVRRTRREWPDGRPRADLTVDWTVEVDGDLGDLGLRLWLNQDGVAIGLRPGAIRRGWYDEVAAVAEAAGLPGFRLLGGPRSTHGDDVGFESARPGEFVYGRWWSRGQMADLDVRAEAVAVAAALQPTINELIRRATGEEPPAPDDPLGPLVEEFRAATSYPTPADEEHKADRQRFAALLAKDAIGLVDPTELARIWTTRRYGNPGPPAVLNTTLRDAAPAEYDRILDSISYLSSGEGAAADRSDARPGPAGRRPRRVRPHPRLAQLPVLGRGRGRRPHRRPARPRQPSLRQGTRRVGDHEAPRHHPPRPLHRRLPLQRPEREAADAGRTRPRTAPAGTAGDGSRSRPTTGSASASTGSSPTTRGGWRGSSTGTWSARRKRSRAATTSTPWPSSPSRSSSTGSSSTTSSPCSRTRGR